MLRRLLSVLFIMAVFSAGATEPVKKLWQSTLYGGIYLNNEQAWLIEPSIAWHFHKYMGVAFGVEFTSQYNQPSRTASIEGYEAELVENERNVAWIIFKPSVIFKSPDLWKYDGGYCRLWLQAEPGISVACPTRNSLTYELKERYGAIGHTIDYRRFRNYGLHWFYWNAKVSLNVAVDRFVIGAGYHISNLDYYSGRRNVMLPSGNQFHVPEKELSQNIFLSLGYRF